MAAQTFLLTGKCLSRLSAFCAAGLALSCLPAEAQTSLGGVNIGASTSSTVTLTIPAAATLGSISVVSQGATRLDFSNGGAGTCATGTNYESGQTCTVQVIFKPAFAGERFGAVLLVDASGNLVASSLLTGTGTAPQIAFGPGTASAVDLMVNGVGFNNPFGVAVDGKGDLFIADNDNARVVEIPAGGSAPIAIDPVIGGSGLSEPGGVAVDGAGNLYISDLDRNLVVEMPVTGGAPILINPTVNGIGLHYPCGMVIDGAGNLYVADVDNGRVVEVPAGGGAPTAIDPLVGGEKLSYPVTLALDSVGNLYIADLFANRVVEVPAGGGSPTAIDPSVNGTGLNFPYGIAIDAADDLYIADANNRIVIVPPSGGAPTALTPTANGEGLNDPIGIALSGVGDLYIADSLNNRIVQVVRSQPPAINFAATAVGTTSDDSPQTVEVENIGNAALSLAVPATGNNPAITTNFTFGSSVLSACPLLTPGSSQPGSLAAGATCLLPISFQPTASGTVYGSLTLTDNNLNAAAPVYATQTIALSGDAPVAALTAASLSFGAQQVQTASGSQQVTLTNGGSAPLAIANIAVTGANASSFVFPNPCGSSLAAGTTCVIQGHFAPAAAGPMGAMITITDNAANSPQTVGLTGAGVYPVSMMVTPSAGTITTAQPLTVTVAVSGTSGEPTPTGTVGVAIGSYTAAAVLAGGSAVIDIPAGSLATGMDTIAATYTPDSTSISLYAGASGDSSVNVTAAQTASAPGTVTSAATWITATTATLAGTVNPNGADTHAMFAYGTSSTLSGATQTASQDLGSTAASDQVTTNLTGLTPSTTYYFQAVAQNSVGTTNGAIFSFTTMPAPYFSVLTSAPLTLAPGATTGNTSTVSITPWYGFTGAVNLSCAISPTAASDPATCAVTPTVTVSNENAQNATLTITTTAASAMNEPVQRLGLGASGAALACVVLLIVPVRRRRWLEMLCWLVLFAAVAGVGCGGGGKTTSGGGGGGGSSNPGTSAGTYTVTVTGVSGSMTETGTVALTVQ
jgi:sugar lactone lactonase YvrE